MRVFIVVGISLYREGLAQLLGTCAEFTVVGAVGTVREAVERLDETSPDVALVDVGIPDLDEMSTALAQRARRIPLVAIGISDVDSDLLAGAEMGITGSVTRESSVEELAAALHRAADGELICSPRTAGTLIRRVAELSAANHRGRTFALLTHREREVAKLIGEDLSNKEIAARLGIEVATVKNHVHNLLDKLRVHRRAEAVRLLAYDARRPSDRL